MKFTRIYQSIIYLIKFKTREETCFDDTNRLEWKKVREMLHSDSETAIDLFRALGGYNPFGPKEDEYTEYQKLAFVQENLKGLVPEQVDAFSIALGKLLRWVNYALEVRIDDVLKRRQQREFEKA